jgi:hypothetical protein
VPGLAVVPGVDVFLHIVLGLAHACGGSAVGRQGTHEVIGADGEHVDKVEIGHIKLT